MRHLNYGHLLYFHTVAAEGSVAAAAAALHVTPQTISGQIKLLEGKIGRPLFVRAGRGLVLSDTGRLVQEYTSEIFSIGGELARQLQQRDEEVHASTLRVGIVDSLPKFVACRLLGEVIEDGAGRLVCREGALETLLGELAVHRLDLVLSDRPVPTGLAVRAWNHPLGESDVAIFAAPDVADELAADFPRSLDGVPILLPHESTALRRRLDHWFDEQDVHPCVVAEFDDSASMKAFGQAGLGVFPSPVVVAEEIERSGGARPVGTVTGVDEHYVAISPERRLRHPAVQRVTDTARRLFGKPEVSEKGVETVTDREDALGSTGIS